ncbi:MAG: tryptophan 7-halogenase [Hellea sp.]|nr:tryptophan 7-halogenase [Hellea sp.]
MNNRPIKRYVIAGGGTAGWMAAAMLAKIMGEEIDLTLIESDAIGTIGVGEATIPPLLRFNRFLGVNEAEFMRETRATFKLGINFENWKNIGEDYFHSFGSAGKDHWTSGFQHFWLSGQKRGIASGYEDYCLEVVSAFQNKFAQLPDNGLNYAYHLDSSAYAKFLRKIAEENGAVRKEGLIEDVKLRNDSGHITSLKLNSGETIEGDFFFDCTGFRSILMGKALDIGYDDWSDLLPCDSAIAVQTKSVIPAPPYTRAIAHDAGWQWRIPLQHRTGNGLIYCSQYLDKDAALQRFLGNIEGEMITEPNFIRFKTGARQKQWEKNCVTLGLSSGFMEPLESTSIHLIQRSVMRFIRMMPTAEICLNDVAEFNEQTFEDMDKIRDFLIMHYYVTDRRDSEFWKYCASMDVPEAVRQKIDLFTETARVFRKNDELFAENSWIQCMMGQGITPKSYHPIADKMTDKELEYFLGQIKKSIAQTASKLPPHEDYVNRYCGMQETG